MIPRILLPALALPVLFAQNPADLFEKAPPEVDKALRERIAQFYQYHVEGKFRQAEQLVAEDTKDYFYTANKPKYLSFEIVRIEYSEEFTKAKATILCETIILAPGFTDKPVKVPVPSRWKLVDGQWFWYVDPEAMNMTPFGRMKPGTGSGATAATPPLPRGQEVQSVLTGVRADKTSVLLAEGPQEVTLSNGMPGHIDLEVAGARIPGVQVKLDRTALGPGEKAVATVAPGKGAKLPATPVVVTIRVVQTGQLIPIQVVPPKRGT